MGRARVYFAREIVLVSDGVPNEPDEVSIFLREIEGVVVHTVGAGRNYDQGFLSSIARDTGGQFYAADNVGDLADVFVAIARQGITRGSQSQAAESPPFWRQPVERSASSSGPRILTSTYSRPR